MNICANFDFSIVQNIVICNFREKVVKTLSLPYVMVQQLKMPLHGCEKKACYFHEDLGIN